MRSRIAILAAILAAVLALLGACDAAPPPAPVTTSPPPAATSAPRTLAVGETCPVTRPGPFQPPPGVSADRLFGSASSYGNGTLWVGALGDGGVITANDNGWKFGWWRAGSGRLRITGHRLDGPAPPLRTHVPDGYGTTEFQSSGVEFPVPGCWELTGDIGTDPLTFVTLVRFSP